MTETVNELIPQHKDVCENKQHKTTEVHEALQGASCFSSLTNCYPPFSPRKKDISCYWAKKECVQKGMNTFCSAPLPAVCVWSWFKNLRKSSWRHHSDRGVVDGVDCTGCNSGDGNVIVIMELCQFYIQGLWHPVLRSLLICHCRWNKSGTNFDIQQTTFCCCCFAGNGWCWSA